MKQDQNSKHSPGAVPYLFTKTQRLSNPESEHGSAGKTELSPSNKSDNYYVRRNLENFSREDSPSSIKTGNTLKRQIQELQERLEYQRQGELLLKDEIQEIHKENIELTQANQVLRSNLFTLQQQAHSSQSAQQKLKLMEQQNTRMQKAMIQLQQQMKEKSQFINSQIVAKTHNSQMLSEMEFEIKELTEIYDMERIRNRELTLKMKQVQEAEMKSKRRIYDLERKLADQSERDSNQSSRVHEREIDNLKEKVRILTSINQRQKVQIGELMAALDTKKAASTLAEIKHEWSNSCPFEQDCSEIGYKCPEDVDLEEMKQKTGDLEEVVRQLSLDNQRMKLELEDIKSMGEATEVETLVIEKIEYSKQVKEQYVQIARLNEELYKYNHEIHSLKEEREHYYQTSKQLQEVNLKLAAEIKHVQENRIKLMKQVSVLTETVKLFERLKESHDEITNQLHKLREQATTSNDKANEMERKNKQLLLYMEEIRLSEQKVNAQLIEKTFQCEQLKNHNPSARPLNCPNSFSRQDEVVLAKMLQDRNRLLEVELKEFKECVLDELRTMSSGLVSSQRKCRQEESKEIIRTLRRKVEAILQIF